MEFLIQRLKQSNKQLQIWDSKSIKNLIKGKFFDIEVDNKKNHLKEIEKISKDLLANPVIENFKIVKK